MGCDLCGAEGQLYEARVEGTLMTVCESCKRHGEVVRRVPTAADLKAQSKAARKAGARSRTGQLSSLKYRGMDASTGVDTRPMASGEVILLVKPSFGPDIKRAREARGLKQEELAQRLRIKESQLHKYETGVKKPDLETARLLEKALRISLVEQHVEEHQNIKAEEAGSLTISDMIKKR